LLVPFLDTAKVGLWRVPNDWDQWHFTVGGGPRLVYNDVFVVRFDLGWGKEEYTSSGSPTGKTVTETGWVRGIYAIVNHPF